MPKSMKNLKSLLKCKFCRRSYNDDDELNRHVQKRHRRDLPYPCGDCKPIPTKPNIPTPAVSKAQPELLPHAFLQCFVCYAKLSTLTEFKHHFDGHHRINATSRSQRFTCAFCQYQCPKQNQFTHHVICTHLEDRYALVKDLKPPEEQEEQALSKIPSKRLRRVRDQDFELMKAIEDLEESIEKEEDDKKSSKQCALGLQNFKPVKKVRNLLISNCLDTNANLFEFTCAFCQDKFLDMPKFLAHAKKYHFKKKTNEDKCI